MWYKCNEKKELGLTKAQIARELVLDVKTVRKYLRMSYDELKSSESYKRMYIKLLDEHPDLSSSQIHDWLRERYPDLPDVNSKTVYNFVKYVRAKYNIEKPVLSAPWQYGKIEETASGGMPRWTSARCGCRTRTSAKLMFTSLSWY